MEHKQRVAYAHEALDRIHVVQTLLASILMGDTEHVGLSVIATSALGSVEDLLQEAYTLQSEYLDDLMEGEEDETV